MQQQRISAEQAQGHWAKTSRLMWITLSVWFIFGFAIHFFARELNEITFLGFPLGFYMASQGALVAFVVVIFWYARKQNKIDEEFGVAEEKQ